MSSAVLGIATIAYLAFIVTHNPVIAATVPAFLSFAACPAMCMGMCGVFFLVNRLSSKNKRKTQMLEGKVVENEASFSCCGGDVSLTDEKQQQASLSKIESSGKT